MDEEHLLISEHLTQLVLQQLMHADRILLVHVIMLFEVRSKTHEFHETQLKIKITTMANSNGVQIASMSWSTQIQAQLHSKVQAGDHKYQ